MVHLSVSASWGISAQWHGKTIRDGTSLFFFLYQLSIGGIRFSRVFLVHLSISSRWHDNIVGDTGPLCLFPCQTLSCVTSFSRAALVHLGISESRHVITRAWQDRVRCGASLLLPLSSCGTKFSRALCPSECDPSLHLCVSTFHHSGMTTWPVRIWPLSASSYVKCSLNSRASQSPAGPPSQTLALWLLPLSQLLPVDSMFLFLHDYLSSIDCKLTPISEVSYLHCHTHYQRYFITELHFQFFYGYSSHLLYFSRKSNLFPSRRLCFVKNNEIISSYFIRWSVPNLHILMPHLI